MFDRIAISDQRLSDKAGPLDLGFLAEALIYYGEVHLLGSAGALEQLLKSCGPELLIELVENYRVRVHFQNQITGIRTDTISGKPTHSLAVMSTMKGHQTKDYSDYVRETFERTLGKKGRTRRLADRFTKSVIPLDTSTDMLNATRDDYLDDSFIENCAKKTILYFIPDYEFDKAFFYRITSEGQYYFIDSNLNWKHLNELYHRTIPASHSSLNPAYLLNYIFTARKMIDFSCSLNSELASDEIYARIISEKVRDIISKRTKSEGELDLFHDFIFDESRPIRERINDGSRKFSDLLPVLKKVDKFRGWIKDIPHDKMLIKEYFRNVTSDSWIDKQPIKSVRWSLFTLGSFALDAVVPGLGTALSAADSFVVDKIAKKWKPDQFVKKELKQFIE